MAYAHRRSARHRGRLIVGVIAAIGLLAALEVGLWFRGMLDRWPHPAVPGALDAGVAPPPPAEAGVLTVDESQLQWIAVAPVELRLFRVERSATGRIAFDEDRTTPVFPAYGGRVVQITGRPGDEVQPGSPLAQIDAPDLVQAESDFIAAAASLKKARNQAELAERTSARQADLYGVRAVAKKDLEQAESDLRSAESDLRAAEGAYAASRDRLRLFGKSDGDVARLEESRQVDPHMLLVAPIGGVVTSRKVGPGQYIKPDNPDPVFTIADLSTMWLFANVAEPDIPLVQVGQTVEVRVLAYPTEVFRARITTIGAAVDPLTRRVAVRAEVANPDHKLKPDMFASFRILTDAEVRSPAVPVGALIRDGDRTIVWVETAPRRLLRREVVTGLQQGATVQVLSGLDAGERVVVDGGLLLTNAQQAASREAGTGDAPPARPGG
ncbi:MAG TPA: efflux RND transporter periplasmic adaptor subunit [Candidatus Methylomirabilis sp.]|nr:efflux RND transporter periplasmic adaptor subunit [Candidatus Methylomirabilis sp.]